MVYTVGAWSCYFGSESKKNIEGEGCDSKAKADDLMVAGNKEEGKKEVTFRVHPLSYQLCTTMLRLPKFLLSSIGAAWLKLSSSTLGCPKSKS